MANKKISELTSYTTPISGDVLPINDTVSSQTKKVTIDNLFNVLSSLFRIKDSSDTTKKVAFDVSGVTTSTTRTITIPDANTTMVGTDVTQTLSNKTLTSPKITVGSDANGDLHYTSNANGTQSRLAIGSNNKILRVVAGLPAWSDETATIDASTTVKGVVEAATSAEINADTATGGTGAALAITPDQLALSKYTTFGGDGSDGALTITSGTTTIDCANAAVVVKNYTSISITGTGNLAFTNPNTNGTVIVLKSQGAVTLTSSSSAVIDLRNMGGAAGAVNVDGTAGYSNNILQSGGGVKGTGAAGSGGTVSLFLTQQDLYLSRYAGLTVGGGGGGPQTGATGAGGRGAGSLIIECNGAFNFTTGTITAAGTIGTSGTGGIGGSGGSGSVYIWYKTLTANSGTITVSSTAGLGTGGGSFAAGGGGAGAASGGAGSGANTGGAGGAGISSVRKI